MTPSFRQNLATEFGADGPAVHAPIETFDPSPAIAVWGQKETGETTAHQALKRRQKARTACSACMNRSG